MRAGAGRGPVTCSPCSTRRSARQDGAAGARAGREVWPGQASSGRRERRTITVPAIAAPAPISASPTTSPPVNGSVLLPRVAVAAFTVLLVPCTLVGGLPPSG